MTEEVFCFIVGAIHISNSTVPLKGFWPTKCFLAKVRSLLDYRMLHSIIDFGLRATYHLGPFTILPHRYLFSIGTALGCSLRLIPFLTKHIVRIPNFYLPVITCVFQLPVIGRGTCNAATGLSDCLIVSFVWTCLLLGGRQPASLLPRRHGLCPQTGLFCSVSSTSLAGRY